MSLLRSAWRWVWRGVWGVRGGSRFLWWRPVADGDTLQIVAGHQVFAPAAAAPGGSILVLAGTIAFDDPRTDGYWSFGTFVADTVIIRMWAIPTVQWDAGSISEGENVQMGVAVGGDPNLSGQALTTYDAAQFTASVAYGGTDREPQQLPVAATGILEVAGLVSGSGVYWVFPNFGNPMTAGEMNVYALIATPS